MISNTTVFRSSVFFLLSGVICIVNSSSLEMYYWRSLESTFTHFSGNGEKWLSESLLQCVLECSTRDPLCDTVRYNRTKLECEGGHGPEVFHPSTSTKGEGLQTAAEQSENLAVIAKAAASTTVEGTEKSDDVIFIKLSQGCDPALGFSMVYTGDSFICLYESPTTADFLTAAQQCDGRKAKLLKIEDERKLSRLAFLNSTQPMYVGLRRTVLENLVFNFKWPDGEQVTNTSAAWLFWSPGNPTRPFNVETCAVLGTDAMLHDVDCTSEFKFFCEPPQQ